MSGIYWDLRESGNWRVGLPGGVMCNRWEEIIGMKKWMAGILGVMAGCVLILGVIVKRKGAMAISVIGGADGPTSLFIAGKVGNRFSHGLILGGVLGLAVVGLFFWKRKQKQ